MSWVATAVGGTAVLGLFGSMDASRKQANTAGDASRMSMDQYLQSRSDLAPWVSSGGRSNASLMRALGLDTPTQQTRENFDVAAYLTANPDVAANEYASKHPWEHYINNGRSEGRAFTPYADTSGSTGVESGSLLKPFTGADLQNEPGYQFGIQQGERGINNMAGATSGRNSGATMKALLKFNQDYGGTKYNDAFNRDAANKNRTYGYLSSVSGTGENAAGMTAGLGANAAGAAGNFATQGADASAAGTVGGINAITGGVSNYLGYTQNQSMLDYLKSLRGGIANTGGSAAFGARM